MKTSTRERKGRNRSGLQEVDDESSAKEVSLSNRHSLPSPYASTPLPRPLRSRGTFQDDVVEAVPRASSVRSHRSLSSRRGSSCETVQVEQAAPLPPRPLPPPNTSVRRSERGVHLSTAGGLGSDGWDAHEEGGCPRCACPLQPASVSASTRVLASFSSQLLCDRSRRRSRTPTRERSGRGRSVVFQDEYVEGSTRESSLRSPSSRRGGSVPTVQAAPPLSPQPQVSRSSSAYGLHLATAEDSGINERVTGVEERCTKLCARTLEPKRNKDLITSTKPGPCS